MMACRRTASGLLLAVLCWLSAGAAPLAAAGRPERAARDGLAAYRAGDYAAALEAFGSAAELRPGVPELLYDAGISAYQLGDYAAARVLLQPAINHATRSELVAAGHLAMGNIDLREAQQLLQQDPAAAAAALEHGIANFERALRVAPGYAAAAQNLELARVLLDEMRRQQPPPQQQDAGAPDQSQQDQQESAQSPAEPQDAGAAAAPSGGAGNEPPPDPGLTEGGEMPPEQDGDRLAQQIIAAEAANAELRRQRHSRLQPVPRDW